MATIATKEIQPVDGKFICPECGKKYDDRAHLGIHRRTHGIQGTSVHAVQNRELRKSLRKKPKTTLTANGRRITAEARENISRAQKARWARFHAIKGEQSTSNGNGHSEKLVAKIMHLRSTGMSVTDVATRLNVSPSSVYKYVKGTHGNGHVRRGHTLPPKTVQKIHDLYAQGMKMSEISRLTGSKPHTIKRYINLNSTTEAPANGSSNGSHPETAEQDAAFNQSLIYIYARLEKEAQIFAEGASLPFPLLATGLADLFRLSSRGQVMGLPSRMPALQR